MLCTEVNPHCRRIKRQICSRHHNSSLGILSCRCYRLYPIPVCPSLILLHKLFCPTQVYYHYTVITSQLLWTTIHPSICCQLTHIYTQQEQAVPHCQLWHLYGLNAFHPCHQLPGCQHCLFLPLFWQGLRERGKSTGYCHGHWNHKSKYILL